MKTTILAAIILSLLSPSIARAVEPWETNNPIARVTREVAQTHPQAGMAVNVWRRYVGPSLQLEEIQSWEAVSDTPENPRRRWSSDNGQTWSDLEPLPDLVTNPQGIRVYWGPGPYEYDPVAQATVSIWLRQTVIDGVDYNHCFSRISRDNGHTWGDPKLLRYQDGDDFDPNDPFKTGFLENNQAYFGQNIYRCGDGSLLFGGASANIPDDAPDPNPNNISAFALADDARNIGAINFVGQWNAAEDNYDWTGSDVSWVPRHVSSRGMMEPAVAELADGRLLTIYRCSNQNLGAFDQPGRKRYTISSDGGQTLSDVAELKYDDGTQFYSPSAYHNLIRHSQTGKLYWVGNILAAPASGNSPRYPLIIAEIDEDNVAIKKDTVTLIDTRNDGDGSGLQLSNFSLLENRQTHEIEVYLTRFGENASDFWGADAYKYTLELGVPMPPLKPPRPGPVAGGPVVSGGATPYAWYRADKGVVVQSTPDKVAYWADQSGNNRHLESIGNPQLIANGQNGRATIAFDGDGDCLQSLSAEWGQAASGTVFAVWRRTGGGDSNQTPHVYDAAEDQQRQSMSVGVAEGSSSISVAGAVYNGTCINHYTTGLPDSPGTESWAVSSASHTTGSTDTLRINGQEIYTGDLLSGGMTGLRIGGYVLTYGRYWEGEIAELIVFEGELSAAERNAVERQLMLRWGIGPPPMPGDANFDGIVNDADAAILAANWQKRGGADWTMGDFNGDGRVDDEDATLLASNWQAGQADQDAAVPEPGTVTLLLCGLIVMLGRRRQACK